MTKVKLDTIVSEIDEYMDRIKDIRTGYFDPKEEPEEYNTTTITLNDLDRFMND